MRSVRMILGVALATMVSGAVLAQDTPLSKQERARLRFERLHESMQRLQVTLAETSPDESRLLRLGNKFVQESRLHEHMTEVRGLLEEGRWDEALEQMTDVREQLQSLMNLLLNRDLDLQELMERIEELEAFKERVEDLITEQQKEKEDAARSEALKKHIEELERAKRDTESLVEEQKALKNAANQAGMAASPKEAAEMEQREGELQDSADELAERLEKLEKEGDELSKPESEADEGSESAEGSAAKGSCSGSCSGAGKAMGDAKKKLGQNKPESSLEDMDRAIKKLQEAIQDLEKMAEDARRELQELPFEQQAKAQEKTRVSTDKLAQDMEKAGEGEDGEPKESTPGTKNVQQAVPKQKAAAGQLKEYKPGKAKQEQQDAKENLEEAQKELEDALAQLRQQLQDEVLRALEERFAAMLAEQKELSARTIVTDRLRNESLTANGDLPAALVERCQGLAEGELGLAAEAGDALKLLEEEGTTAVFPELVVELEEDLTRVGERLAGQKTDKATQRMQAEIEETLKMLIDALRRTIEDSEAGECGSCNGEPPLVPMSAELKLILALQKRVHKRTVAYDTEIPAQMRVTEEATTEAGEIARKQGRVKQLTRKLAVKLNKEAQPEENE